MKQQASDVAAVHITTLSVRGLACDDCAAHVARMLEGVNGVVHVEARRGQREFVVEHLPGFIDAAMVAAAVRTLGYGADVATSAPDVDCLSPAAEQSRSTSCCCGQRDNTAQWANLGTSTIG